MPSESMQIQTLNSPTDIVIGHVRFQCTQAFFENIRPHFMVGDCVRVSVIEGTNTIKALTLAAPKSRPGGTTSVKVQLTEWEEEEDYD